MRTNPFRKVYDICNSSNSKEKLENLPTFPRYIDIEPTNTCNFSCMMCPTGILLQKRKKGFMTDETFHKILDEITEYKTPLRFFRWGEPTLHPKLLNYIKEAKARGIICHINTNGSLMNDKLIESLINVGLDSIKFSFQGINKKGYNELRNTDFYEDLLNIIKKFYKIRGERDLPFIHIATTTTNESEAEIEHFKKEVESFVDLVTVGKTVFDFVGITDPDSTSLKDEDKERLRRLRDQESAPKVYKECPEVFDKLSINWNGTVSACCSDYDDKMIVGDLAKNSLKDIWRSEKMNHYRLLLADMRHAELPLCKDCYGL